MASILYIDRLSPDTAKTLGQSLNNALTYGLGLMVGFFLNGTLYAHIGSFGLFQASSLIAAAGGCCFTAFSGPPAGDGEGKRFPLDTLPRLIIIVNSESQIT